MSFTIEFEPYHTTALPPPMKGDGTSWCGGQEYRGFSGPGRRRGAKEMAGWFPFPATVQASGITGRLFSELGVWRGKASFRVLERKPLQLLVQILPFIVPADLFLDLCGAVGSQTQGTVGDPGTVLRWVHLVSFSPTPPHLLSPREIESGDWSGKELVWKQLCMSVWEQLFLSPCTCCQRTPRVGGPRQASKENVPARGGELLSFPVERRDAETLRALYAYQVFQCFWV